MPMDELYGFKVEGNVPTSSARKRIEENDNKLLEVCKQLEERVMMLEAENNNLREQQRALEKEVRMLANKITTL